MLKRLWHGERNGYYWQVFFRLWFGWYKHLTWADPEGPLLDYWLTPLIEVHRSRWEQPPYFR